METTYISIDVATRSLAIGVYSMRSFVGVSENTALEPRDLNDYLDSLVQPRLMEVHDLNDGAKVKDMSYLENAVSLKAVLTQIEEKIACFTQSETVVLVEYQMNANHRANAIFNMIIYHYAGRYPLEIIKPSWKNTLALHPSLTLSAFLGRCSSNYQANKAHTRTNMKYFLTMIGRLDLLDGIAKSNQDDIADTLMQALVFHKRRCQEQ